MQKLHLYDSSSQSVREFVGSDPDRIAMYVCGPTVYDVPHIGNMRTAVVFDVLYRLLTEQANGKRVVYVRNYTDIDDKIIVRANELGISIHQLTEKTIKQYEEFSFALNVLPPTFSPRATDDLLEMVSMIESLVEKGFAYISEGHALFDVTKAQGTRLHHNENMEVGARIAPAAYKRDPRDFVLWKPSKEGEPSYEGPNGLHGRPGWHIECSAMIFSHFGHTIDIHGGGIDLLFPHHQCEIHQSENYNDQPLAEYWVHSGMLTVDGKKMSKSAGNFITVPEVLEKYPGETLRYFYLSGHYRQPLDFTWEKIEAAHKSLDRLYRALNATASQSVEVSQIESVRLELNEDLNTPAALAQLHNLASAVFKSDKDNGEMGLWHTSMAYAGDLLGLFRMTYAEWSQYGIDKTYVAKQIAIRTAARENRDWKKADEIRAHLLEMNVQLEDTPVGTTWSAI